MRLTRRAFAVAAGAGLAVLGSRAGSVLARVRVPTGETRYRTLSRAEVATLERLADAVVPGSRAAGIARFIDDGLSVAVEKSALTVKYLGVNPPFARFYKDAIKAAEDAAVRLFGTPVIGLKPAHTNRLVAAIAKAEVRGWTGPPSPLFHFTLRSDGLDVVYGTRAGFDRLHIPYMAHILPPRDW